jgi:hypothetical protein
MNEQNARRNFLSAGAALMGAAMVPGALHAATSATAEKTWPRLIN